MPALAQGSGKKNEYPGRHVPLNLPIEAATESTEAPGPLHALPSEAHARPKQVSTPPPRMLGFHDFCYPGVQFRICYFSGPSLPQAASLVKQAYGRLGYRAGDGSFEDAAHLVPTASLQAVSPGATLGTLSINLDGRNGLLAETLYPEEVATLRGRGGLCEFTQLALDTELAGREVLCSLFYVAYVFSHVVHSVRHLLIEVNPRHERFYERLLGFRRIGGERICARVGAPAVLLHLDFSFTREQIERARRGLSVVGTTLYRYAAPRSDEQSLVRQMAHLGNAPA